MSEENYDLEIEKVIKVIKEKKYKIVGLQFPEGLKKYAVKIASEIEQKTGAKTITFIDPIYGACDIQLNEAKDMNIELLVHFGHVKFK